MSVQWKRENAGESAENTQVSVSRMLRSHEESKAHSHGVTGGNEGLFIEAWKSDDFCYKASQSLDESCSCPSILWPE